MHKTPNSWTATWLVLPVIPEPIHAQSPEFTSQTSQIRGHKIVLDSRGSRTWTDAMVRKPFRSGLRRAFSDHYPELSGLVFVLYSVAWRS